MNLRSTMRGLRYWRCPICGREVYVKSAALHFEGHVRFDAEAVAAWRAGAPTDA